VLQLRAALDIVDAELTAVEKALVALAAKHRDTVMAGRTHMQRALPVTFGYKAAVWLSSVRRDKARLAALRPRLLVVQFSGAAGTLASLGDKGLEVQSALADELKLAVPDITWHAARDGIAEAGSTLAILSGGLAKIATDVMLMMQTEVAEAFEPFVKGRGGSSTMPQKRNPISCEMILAIAKAVRSDAGLLLDAMAADHERATGPWHLEWIALPRSFLATAAALYQARFMLEGLIVDGDRMRRNLDITGGLIVAEAAMMALAPHTGRGAAHDIVYDCCRAALDSGTSLLAELEKRDDVTKHLDRAALARVVDPAHYLGTAPQMVDRMVKG
jgi:3-carboxy-cis,cis-muconate cycloisomerase